MSKIKTRKKGKEKSVEILSKSRIVGRQMKNAFIRPPKKAAALTDDSQITPDEYAGDKARYTAEDLSHGAARVVGAGIKTAEHKSKAVLQATRERKTASDQTERRGFPPKADTAISKSPERNAMLQQAGETSQLKNISASNPIPDSVEQGRELTKRRTTKRINTAQQIKQQERITAPQSEKIARRGPANIKTPARTVKQPARAIKGGAAQKRIEKSFAGVAGHTARTTRKAMQTAKNIAPASSPVNRAVVTMARDIVVATKGLLTAIAAGGWVAVISVVIICLIGLLIASPFGIFFSGEDSGTGQTIQTAVREINTDYQAQIDTIKASTSYDAVEMSGSCAAWREVLAVYAVKTSTAPDSAQEVASMDDFKKALLRDLFWQMTDISSRTETDSSTEIVLRDDGHGNLVETEVTTTFTTLYITVQHKSAGEIASQLHFSSEQLAQLAELLAEENNRLWSAVLYGVGPGDCDMVAVALSQLGNVGGDPYWSWYGFLSHVDWCACFVSWCANECGYIDTGIVPKFASCSEGAAWFQRQGLWQGNSFEPRPGDLIFFDWDDDGQDGSPDHVGIVKQIEDGQIRTIEGNSDNQCCENSYPIDWYEIYGYGLLHFS